MAESIILGTKVAGGIASVYGAHMQGVSEQQVSAAEARQLEQKSKAAIATSQKEASEQKRRARLLQSQLIARAAASGSSVSDVGIENLLAGLEAEGEYNALSALYEGKTRADSLSYAAKVRRFEGKQAKRAGNIRAFAKGTKALSSFQGSGNKPISPSFEY